ncbi:AAA family ATPase [Microcoleus sp. FACHB-672]|uniref:AAA family ATPase n=1 Tax=Microcoleus sp. FACHB-672 TaxID=2692825 RepID=UPI00168613AD|nr:AAA family ATPase [Microcoleus sp. FACHB-672]MBD2039826.1 ATP-binding protein [Microcoleus sp. FACHB-672]
MAFIHQIIRQAVNPFDSTTFRPGNFWQEDQDPALTVDSIHQEVVTEIEELLDKVAQDQRTRTILLAGDSGSGKSYLLGRLKKLLNSKAFFAYIGPWPDSDFIWRHTLRNTVDSLMYVPQGRHQSQLLLWLKSLSAFRDEGLRKQLLGERNLFIHNLKVTFPSGIYNANEFFGVLYELTNPEMYPLACEWLKGDDLDEETLKALKVKRAIETEEVALKILGNFGKISASTQPIVLCFDNLDNIDRALDGFINLQALFNVNSIIHNQKLKNFLVIVSIVTNTWKQNSKRIQQADQARIDLPIRLQPITLDQAETLWASRLYSLHRQANYLPASSIYPLNRQHLEDKFPGGKTRPRYVLMLGRQLFQEAKTERFEGITEFDSDVNSTPIDPLAAFQLVWLKEFNKTQEKVSRIRQFSAPELIQMLREALNALQVHGIQTKLLPSPTYASYSLSYHLPVQLGRIGVVWTEEPNLISFCNLMKACQKALKQNLCQTVHLIRAEGVGTSNNQGYKLYNQIFTGYRNRHIIPDMTSVHYLATYHSLVNAACAGELVVGDHTPSLSDLEALIRKSKILRDCPLLQSLGVFSGSTYTPGSAGTSSINQQKPVVRKELAQPFHDVKEFLLNLVKTQQMMGCQILIQNALDQFPLVENTQIEQLIEELCQENQIFILDPNAEPAAQLVCLINK